jgi:hypothetical protein
MKVTEHVTQLLKQGRKPKELLELGFSKHVITRVRKQLREEKTSSQSKIQKGQNRTKGNSLSAVTAPTETTSTRMIL